jgi:hypothetical protein
MASIKTLQWALALTAFFVSGCAALHVDVVPTIDWRTASSVTLQAPERDPWQLTAAVRNELQRMGLTLFDEGGSPNLLVRYFVKEGPDLNADGDLLTRLQSFHVQFVDPSTGAFVAVADYFYAADNLTEPQVGVKEAFAGLRQDLGMTDSPRQALSQDAAAASTSLTSPASAPPAAPQRTEPMVADPLPSPPQATQSAGVAESSEEPVEMTRSAESPAADVVPLTDKAQAKPVAPQTQSPWVPRFESWGFENWGEEPDVDHY